MSKPTPATGHMPFPGSRTLAEVGLAAERSENDRQRRIVRAASRTWEAPATTGGCSVCWRTGRCIGDGCPILEAA